MLCSGWQDLTRIAWGQRKYLINKIKTDRWGKKPNSAMLTFLWLTFVQEREWNLYDGRIMLVLFLCLSSSLSIPPSLAFSLIVMLIIHILLKWNGIVSSCVWLPLYKKKKTFSAEWLVYSVFLTLYIRLILFMNHRKRCSLFQNQVKHIQRQNSGTSHASDRLLQMVSSLIKLPSNLVLAQF